jgi:hypothetical protein
MRSIDTGAPTSRKRAAIDSINDDATTGPRRATANGGHQVRYGSKAEVATLPDYVRFVPTADITTSSDIQY